MTYGLAWCEDCGIKCGLAWCEDCGIKCGLAWCEDCGIKCGLAWREDCGIKCGLAWREDCGIKYGKFWYGLACCDKKFRVITIGAPLRSSLMVIKLQKKFGFCHYIHCYLSLMVLNCHQIFFFISPMVTFISSFCH